MPEIFISHIIKTHPWIIILIIKHLTLGLYFEHHNTLIICLSHDNYTPPSYFYALPYWLTIYLLGCFLRPHPSFQSPSLTFLANWWGMCSVLAALFSKTCCSPKALLTTIIVIRLTKRGGSAIQGSMDVPEICAGTKPHSFHLFLKGEVTKAVGS